MFTRVAGVVVSRSSRCSNDKLMKMRTWEMW